MPCIDAKDVPTRPEPTKRPLPTDANRLLSLALARLGLFESYADKADAVIAGCVQP